MNRQPNQRVRTQLQVETLESREAPSSGLTMSLWSFGRSYPTTTTAQVKYLSQPSLQTDSEPIIGVLISL